MDDRISAASTSVARAMSVYAKRDMRCGEEPIADEAFFTTRLLASSKVVGGKNPEWELMPVVAETQSELKRSGKNIQGRVPLYAGSISLPGVGDLFALPRYPLWRVRDLMVQNPWHFACISAKATTATDIGYYFDVLPGKRGNRNIINKDRSIIDRFQDTIFEKSGMELSDHLLASSIDYFSVGNFAFELEMNGDNLVECLYSVPSISMYVHKVYPLYVQSTPTRFFTAPAVRQRKSGSSTDVVAAFRRFGSTVNLLELEDVQNIIPEPQKGKILNQLLVIRNLMQSLDPYYGISDVIPALAAVYGDKAAMDYNLQFFENNAVPRYAVTIKGGKVTHEVRDAILNFLTTEVKGNAHRAIIIPLPRGMEAQFTAVDATANEASFLAYKKMNREEITAVHRVPPSEVGIMESAIKANSQQQAKNFYLKVIRPYQMKLLRAMNRLLRVGLGVTSLEMHFDNIEYTDDRERAEVANLEADAYSKSFETVTKLVSWVQEQVTSGMLTQDEGRSLVVDACDRLKINPTWREKFQNWSFSGAATFIGEEE